MPELPEVETVARGVAKYIKGQRIASARLDRPDMLHGNGGSTQRLVDRRVTDVRRWGKQIRICLSDKGKSRSDGLTLYVHLGMTGRLVVVDSEQPVERHTHLRIEFAGRPFELRFCDPRRFGGIWLVADAKTEDKAKHTPAWCGRRQPPTAADPLVLSLAEMRGFLRRRRQIKALLLDQQPISGIGNIYCDELLFRAGVHPQTLASDLAPQTVRRVWQAMRRVLNEAIRAGGSSISDYRDVHNQLGRFQIRHRAYGRTGQPCRRCRRPIERLIVAGRGTHLCPHCQPLRGSKTGVRRV